ncbi:MAG: hypothetical protein JXB88_10590 [Spirochaetales bacterium]|nr:hypothetical protein [Spirochaetales bacterium]
MEIVFKESLSDHEYNLDNYILGPRPDTKPTPDCYAILYNNDTPVRRFDLYDDDFYDFKKLYHITGKWIIICFGNHVHWFNLVTTSIISHKLSLSGSFFYFCEILEYKNNILIATDEKLYNYDSNSNLIWKSESISVDGVIINDIKNNYIYCSCEMDPPGGWVEKKINIENGKVDIISTCKG